MANYCNPTAPVLPSSNAKPTSIDHERCTGNGRPLTTDKQSLGAAMRMAMVKVSADGERGASILNRSMVKWWMVRSDGEYDGGW
jgi:hypothetical protein